MANTCFMRFSVTRIYKSIILFPFGLCKEFWVLISKPLKLLFWTFQKEWNKVFGAFVCTLSYRFGRTYSCGGFLWKSLISKHDHSWLQFGVLVASVRVLTLLWESSKQPNVVRTALFWRPSWTTLCDNNSIWMSLLYFEISTFPGASRSWKDASLFPANFIHLFYTEMYAHWPWRPPRDVMRF